MGYASAAVTLAMFHSEVPMRINRLSSTNFQGASFDHEMAPVTLFVGSNTAGKSTRINALHFALHGCVPAWRTAQGKVVKETAELFRLASGGLTHASVSIGTSDGVSYARNLVKNGTRVMREEPDWSLPLECSDATELLALSDAQRVAYLFQRTKLPKEFTIESLARTITANVKNIAVKNNTPYTEEVAHDLLESIPLGADIKSPVQSWLMTVVELVTSQKKLAAQNVARMEKTGQGLTQVAAAAPPDPGVEQKIVDAESKLYVLLQRAAETSAKARSAAEALAEAERKVAAAPAGSVQSLEQARLELEKLCANQPPDPGDKSKLQQAVNVAQAAFDKAERAEQVVSAEIRRLEMEVTGFKGGIGTVKTCPTCGQTLAVKNKAKLAKAAKVKLLAATAAHEALVEVFNETAEKLNDAAGAMEIWDRRCIAQSEWSAACNRASYLYEQERIRSATAESTAALVADLPRLRHIAEKSSEDNSNMKELLEDTRGMVSCLEDQHKALVAWRAEAAARAKAATEAGRARAELSVLKEACAMLLGLQAKLVDAAIKPLLVTANSLFGGILDPLEYRDGELGLATKRGLSTWQTMSGYERRLAFAAIQVALASQAPMKLVIIDEATVLDGDRKLAVIERIRDLVHKGKLDQAIIVDTEVPEPLNAVPLNQMKVIKI